MNLRELIAAQAAGYNDLHDVLATDLTAAELRALRDAVTNALAELGEDGDDEDDEDEGDAPSLRHGDGTGGG